jgi:tetratricopeptide (TPR) repeat protein
MSSSSPSLVLDAATERVAVNLLRHLEWQADGFSLVFLFADVGPSMQLADWLDERLALQGRPLQRQDAKDQFAREPEAAVDYLMGQLADLSSRSGATWFAVQRHPNDQKWNAARSQFLARLNERRFLLERDLSRPLVLVLPADFRSEARNMAPDIWHVRAASEELRVVRSTEPEPDISEERGSSAQPAESPSELLAFEEWQRMLRQSGSESVYLPTAARAIAELLDHGRPGDAEQVALAALSVARTRASLGSEPSALRDLSVSLNNVGQVARAQGDWKQAGAVYSESLTLRRQLVERLGGTPEALRDLSVSLDNVGQVARAQGDWKQAGAVYSESLTLRRQLVERLGGTPEALEDLAISLLNVASVSARSTALKAEGRAIVQDLISRYSEIPRYTEFLAALQDDNSSPPETEPDSPT